MEGGASDALAAQVQTEPCFGRDSAYHVSLGSAGNDFFVKTHPSGRQRAAAQQLHDD